MYPKDDVELALLATREGGLHALHEGVHALGRDLVADRGVGALPVVVRLDELDHGVPRLVPGIPRAQRVHLVRGALR